jgi:hypothetical protein
MKRSTEWWESLQPELERLAKLGMRAREIGEAIGVTKSAVIGRSRRTGVKLLERGHAIIRALGGTETLFPCGHPRTEENSIKLRRRVRDDGWCTICRICECERQQRRYAKAKNNSARTHSGRHPRQKTGKYQQQNVKTLLTD